MSSAGSLGPLVSLVRHVIAPPFKGSTVRSELNEGGRVEIMVKIEYDDTCHNYFVGNIFYIL